MKIYLKGVNESLIKLYSIENRHSQVDIGCYERVIERCNQVAFQQLQVKQLPAVKLSYHTHLAKRAYAFLFCSAGCIGSRQSRILKYLTRDNAEIVNSYCKRTAQLGKDFGKHCVWIS